jgi:phytoene dehydrogenase-like protein
LATKTYDAIIIGAGHNGLTSAAYLARAGLDVVVLERQPYIGGAAVSRELYDGWTYSNCSYVCSLMRPEIMRELELSRHGLQVIPYEGNVTMLTNGDSLVAHSDHDMFRREVARHSAHDAEAYDRYSRDVRRKCRYIRPMLLQTPPDPTSLKPRDLMGMYDIGRHFADLGEAEMCEVIRFWTMSAAEYLDEYFETDLMKAHLAGSGIIGTALGPCSPGSAYVLLHHYMGEVDGHMGAWGFARGGMGAVSGAIASAFQEAGGEIRVDAPVDQIIVRDGQVEGVALVGGDEVRSKVVLSNLDVKNTFLNVMDPADLPADFLHRVKHFKARGSSGKLNIALDGVPYFPSIPEGCSEVVGGDLGLLGTMEEVERAYDDWKEGRWSRRPFLDMMIPTLIDPTMAPPGKHYMSVFVQYAPPHLADGEWDDENRKAFGDTVIDLISEFSPNFKDLILDMEVRSPQDIENEVGITEGNIFHGELTMDQLLFNRPVPGYAQYRGPVAGMYMCGSSNHPGGGVMGAPGFNAAREVLGDLKIAS